MFCPACQAQLSDQMRFCPHDGARLRGSTAKTQGMYDPLLGQILDGRYRLENMLGEGGMGVVYAARHVVIGKPVAVKLLRREYSRDETQLQRFVQEARAATAIGHPNIIDISDFGVYDNQAYFVMEYLAGVTLAGEIEAHGAISPARIVKIAKQVCHALQPAHEKGIIHRDLKPENIFLLEKDGKQDFIKVLDFGVSKVGDAPKLTKAGTVFGTPEHMSPEMARGIEVDARSDVYALGTVFYEALTGHVPFSSDTILGTLSKQLHEIPKPLTEVRPDMPADLSAIVMRCLEKPREARPQSMGELAAELSRWEESRIGMTVPPATADTDLIPPPSAPARESMSGADTVPVRSAAASILAWALAAVAVIALAGVGFWRYRAGREGQPKPRVPTAKSDPVKSPPLTQAATKLLAQADAGAPGLEDEEPPVTQVERMPRAAKKLPSKPAAIDGAGVAPPRPGANPSLDDLADPFGNKSSGGEK